MFKSVSKREANDERKEVLNTSEANSIEVLLNNRTRFLNTPTASFIEYPDVFQMVSLVLS